MNIPFLIKTLKTNKLSEVVANIDAAPIDMNLAIWDAIDSGAITVDEKKDSIEANQPAGGWRNPELASKIIRTIQHYANNEANITRGRLLGTIKDPVSMKGYPLHEYLMTLQDLIDEGEVIELDIEIPEIKKKRPYHHFVFLCLPGNDNEEWNAKAVNKWIAEWEKK